MDRDFWKRQTNQPLFENILWSRPENKASAGRLLIVGGNSHALAAPAQAYTQALKTGVGECRVVMPEAVKKLVGHVLPDCEFAAATPSGSFAKKALVDLLTYAAWSDTTLIAGDLGRNSETAILLEDFVKKSPTPLVVTRDAADYFMRLPQPVLDRPQTTLVVSLAQLQKMAMHSSFPKALTYDMDFLPMVDWLHDFSTAHQAKFILKHNQTIFVAAQGQVSSTKLGQDMPIWRLQTAVPAAVFWLQNPQKAFEALTTGVYTTTSVKD